MNIYYYKKKIYQLNRLLEKKKVTLYEYEKRRGYYKDKILELRKKRKKK
ncbi:MAG: hypothetical protein AABY22_24740 [Nanoarchaeota archaeon]